MRFSEFADTDDLEEDLAAALDMKKKQLANQAKMIANRKAMLKNQEASQANREAVKKLASHHLTSK